MNDQDAAFDPARRHLLALPLAMAAGCSTAAAPPSGGRQAEWATPATLTLSTTLRHWLYLPPGYAERPEQRWPLIVFLHGSGERGADLGKVRAHGLPRLIEAGQQYPALVVSPQCEEGDDWDAHLLHAMLGALLRQWRIDPQRVTATGLSMGGGGCWSWAMSYPQDLAGIAPVCGYGSHIRIERMRSVPVRAYHGEADTVVPVAAQRELVSELRAAGGQAELTVYPGVGHDAWNPAYADPALVAWLLARSRSAS